MSRRKGGTYAVHLLGTDTEEGVLKDFGSDGMKASLFYTRYAIFAQRRAVLFFDGHLPGMDREVIDSYVPPEGGKVHRGALMVRLGDPQPAWMNPAERAALEDADETEGERNVRQAQSERRAAALWYAKGFIDCVGGLSPYSDEDASAFADWHSKVTETESGFFPIPRQWERWSAQRREETGK